MTWRPLPKSVAEQDAVPVAASLERVAARIGAPHPRAVSAVFGRWAEVVGPEIAAHTEPRSLGETTLVIAVDDSRWVSQLKWMAPQLVQRLNDAAKVQAVTRIDVRLERPSSHK